MFENSLIDLDKKQRRGIRWWLMPVALGIHIIGGGVILFAQFWNVPAVPEPPVNVVFVNAAPPPPPPPPPAAKAPPKVETVKPTVIVPSEPVQPVEVPKEIPKADPVPVESVGVEGGVEGGIPGGSLGGVPGGVPGGTPGGVPGGVVDDAPLRVGGSVKKPELITQIKPVYTELARKARVAGTVIVEAIIDERGNVTNVRVLKGLPMGLDRSAADAVEKWKFRPATLEGRPVKVYYVLTVNFQVQ